MNYGPIAPPYNSVVELLGCQERSVTRLAELLRDERKRVPWTEEHGELKLRLLRNLRDALPVMILEAEIECCHECETTAKGQPCQDCQARKEEIKRLLQKEMI